MVRQAHTYLVGAVSGATLIVIAIAVFVLLVSAQVFRDWPIAALGDSGGSAVGVSDAHSAAGGGGTAEAAPTGTAANSGAGTAPSSGGGGGNHGNVASGGSVDSAAPAPTASTGGGSEGGGGGAGGGGGNSPTSSTPSSGSNSPSPSSGGSSGSSGGGSAGGTGGTATAATGKIAETVNNTVGAVDETVTGGALEKSGVTGATEGLVNGVVGPESPVGKVADETVGALEGLLHPQH